MSCTTLQLTIATTYSYRGVQFTSMNTIFQYMVPIPDHRHSTEVKSSVLTGTLKVYSNQMPEYYSTCISEFQQWSGVHYNLNHWCWQCITNNSVNYISTFYYVVCSSVSMHRLKLSGYSEWVFIASTFTFRCTELLYWDIGHFTKYSNSWLRGLSNMPIFMIPCTDCQDILIIHAITYIIFVDSWPCLSR